MVRYLHLSVVVFLGTYNNGGKSEDGKVCCFRFGSTRNIKSVERALTKGDNNISANLLLYSPIPMGVDHDIMSSRLTRYLESLVFKLCIFRKTHYSQLRRVTPATWEVMNAFVGFCRELSMKVMSTKLCDHLAQGCEKVRSKEDKNEIIASRLNDWTPENDIIVLDSVNDGLIRKQQQQKTESEAKRAIENMCALDDGTDSDDEMDGEVKDAVEVEADPDFVVEETDDDSDWDPDEDDDDTDLDLEPADENANEDDEDDENLDHLTGHADFEREMDDADADADADAAYLSDDIEIIDLTM